MAAQENGFVSKITNKQEVNGLKTWKIYSQQIFGKDEKFLKIIRLTHPENRPDFLLVDIRLLTLEGKTSKIGICLTQCEFDFFIRAFIIAKRKFQHYENKDCGRMLILQPIIKKSAYSGVRVTQLVNNVEKTMFFSNEDCKNLSDIFPNYLEELYKYKIQDTTFETDVEGCTERTVEDIVEYPLVKV